MGAAASLLDTETRGLPETAFKQYQMHIQKAVMAEVAASGLSGAELEAHVLSFISENEVKLRADAMREVFASVDENCKFSEIVTKTLSSHS